MKRILSVLLCLVICVSAFIFSNDIKSFAVSTGYVNATNVRIRNAPTTSGSTVLGSVSNAYVIVNYETHGLVVNANYGDLWYNITYNDITGFLYGEYLQITEPEPEPEPEPGTTQKSWKVIINAYVNVRNAPGTADRPGGGTVICSYDGGIVTTFGIENDSDGDPWYKVMLSNGVVGYVYKKYVSEITYNIDPQFEAQISAFPERYKLGLRYLHTSYPNWKFVPDVLPISLDYAVKQESGRKLISKSLNPSADWITDSGAATLEGGYYYASDTAIKYFLSPENFFDPANIFMFMSHNYNEGAENYSSVKAVLKGSFMDNDYYINLLLKVGKENNVSPCVLASTLIQEQGYGGTSPLISGNYPGYEGYYNFFNVGASGKTKDEIYLSGMIKAKENGWDSVEASISGGARYFANGYIYAGQNTYFYTDFNVVNQVWWHQYASNISDSSAKARAFSNAFKDNMQNAFTFKIPVYSGAVCSHTYSKQTVNSTCIDDGYTIYVCTKCGHSYTADIVSKLGHSLTETVIDPTTEAQGYTIHSCSRCGYGYTDNYTEKLILGDINDDGTRNAEDASILALYIAKKTEFTEKQKHLADMDKNGKLDINDVVLITK